MAAILELTKSVCSGPKFFGGLSDKSWRSQYLTFYQIWYLHPEGEHISVLPTPLITLIGSGPQRRPHVFDVGQTLHKVIQIGWLQKGL